jgi:hypothetical protein
MYFSRAFIGEGKLEVGDYIETIFDGVEKRNGVVKFVGTVKEYSKRTTKMYSNWYSEDSFIVEYGASYLLVEEGKPVNIIGWSKADEYPELMV